MESKYKCNDTVCFWSDKLETLIKTKVKSNGANGFYWLDDNKIDCIVPENELFTTEEDCLNKVIFWNNASIYTYEKEIEMITKINKKIEEQLDNLSTIDNTFTIKYEYYIDKVKHQDEKTVKGKTKKEVIEQIKAEVETKGGCLSPIMILVTQKF